MINVLLVISYEHFSVDTNVSCGQATLSVITLPVKRHLCRIFELLFNRLSLFSVNLTISLLSACGDIPMSCFYSYLCGFK